MKRLTLLAVLLLLPTGGLRAGMEEHGTRQSAGIFVRMDGKVLTIYLDFETAKFRGARVQVIPMTLTTDIELRIQGRVVRAGRHDWLLEVAEDAKWSLGEDASKAKKGSEPPRFLLAVASPGGDDGYLTAAFSPDFETDTVLLKIRFGPREGTLRLGLTERSVAAAEDQPIDIVALRSLCERLRIVGGKLAATRRDRHAWSTFLCELGDAIVDCESTCYLVGAEFQAEGDAVGLKVRGKLVGGRDEVDRLCARVSSGQLSRIFERVGSPLARKAEGDDAWGFEFDASAKKKWWDRIEPVSALSEGTDLEDLAKEILLIEARLAKETSDAILTLSECQSRLLSAKRSAGVIISKIEPSKPVAGEDGIGWMDVTLHVAGSGPSLVRFVREVEEWVAPLRIVPRRLGQGAFGPEAVLDLRFFRYEPLKKRKPGLFSSVQAKGMSAGFERQRDMYLSGVGSGSRAPFATPSWSRDPFVKVIEEE